MDLIEDTPRGNAPEFTVSEISGAVKRLIEDEFARVRVRGEVGRVVLARTGHLYFDLKDDRNVLAAVSWKGQVARMSVRPEEGMEVIATGRLTTFGPQSKYQLQVETVEPAGAGALMAMLEARRKALAAEGLFDAARKRPLPWLPEVIGVVTSPTGAVIRDILHRLRDRFPVRVLVWPVPVQGQDCAPSVARAIAGFNALPVSGGPVPRPDVLIVARGGGSVEDLWGFNDEAVVRAAAGSAIPLISAVGHETDTTLIDHAADRRAPTPTAAAELAVPVRADLITWAEGMGARLGRAARAVLTGRAQRLRDLARALPRPEALVGQAAQRLDLWAGRLEASGRGGLDRRRLLLDKRAAPLRPALLVQRLAAARASADRAGARLAPALGRGLARRAERLADTARALDRASPRGATAVRQRELSRLADRLDAAADRRMADSRRALDAVERLRQTLGYTATLRRGFAVVRAGGAVITTASAAAQATAPLEIEFADGVHTAGAPPRGATKKGAPPEGQGTLF